MDKSFLIFAVVLVSMLNLGCGISPKRVRPAEVSEVTQESESKKNINIRGSNAVIALMQKAQEQSKAGKNAAAGATIERALRIDPKNPALWYNLALVKYTLGECASVINLAKKSNSFLADKHQLAHKNRQLISECRK